MSSEHSFELLSSSSPRPGNRLSFRRNCIYGLNVFMLLLGIMLMPVSVFSHINSESKIWFIIMGSLESGLVTSIIVLPVFKSFVVYGVLSIPQIIISVVLWIMFPIPSSSNLSFIVVLWTLLGFKMLRLPFLRDEYSIMTSS